MKTEYTGDPWTCGIKSNTTRHDTTQHISLDMSIILWVTEGSCQDRRGTGCKAPGSASPSESQYPPQATQLKEQVGGGSHLSAAPGYYTLPGGLEGFLDPSCNSLFSTAFCAKGSPHPTLDLPSAECPVPTFPALNHARPCLPG